MLALLSLAVLARSGATRLGRGSRDFVFDDGGGLPLGGAAALNFSDGFVVPLGIFHLNGSRAGAGPVAHAGRAVQMWTGPQPRRTAPQTRRTAPAAPRRGDEEGGWWRAVWRGARRACQRAWRRLRGLVRGAVSLLWHRAQDDVEVHEEAWLPPDFSDLLARSMPGLIDCADLDGMVGELRAARRAGGEVFAVRPVNCRDIRPGVFAPSFVKFMLGAPVLVALSEDVGKCVYRFSGASLEFTCSRAMGCLLVEVRADLGTSSKSETLHFRFPFPALGPCGCSDIRKAFTSAELTMRAWVMTNPFDLLAMRNFIEGLAQKQREEEVAPGRRFERIAAQFRHVLTDGGLGAVEEAEEDGLLLERTARHFRTDLERLAATGAPSNSTLLGDAMRAACVVVTALTDPEAQSRLDIEGSVRGMAPITAPAA